MNSLRTRLKQLPKHFRVYAPTTFVVHFIAYYLPDALDLGEPKLLGSAFDESIPFVPGFVYIYVGAFVFWLSMFAYVYSKNRDIARCLFVADLICKAVAFATYCLYPCTMVQPAAEEIRGFGAWLMRIVYANDTPTKLLPSMHCFLSLILALPVLTKRIGHIPLWLRVFAPSYALLVCLSTVFVKQHVLADVYTAAILAFLAWGLSLLFWRIVDGRRATDKAS